MQRPHIWFHIVRRKCQTAPLKIMKKSVLHMCGQQPAFVIRFETRRTRMHMIRYTCIMQCCICRSGGVLNL